MVVPLWLDPSSGREASSLPAGLYHKRKSKKSLHLLRLQLESSRPRQKGHMVVGAGVRVYSQHRLFLRTEFESCHEEIEMSALELFVND